MRSTLLILVLLLAACGGGADVKTERAATDRSVVIAYGVDMEGVNELVTASTPIQTALLYFSLFLPLLDELDDYQTGPPTFAPRLAESYEFSADRLALTFQLRDDVAWSDGVPVTAEDVRWTWQAQASPEVAWAYADVKSRITDVEVVTAHTVRFHFSETYANQLIDANFGVVLPKHAWSRLPFAEWRDRGSWFFDNLVVSGPFTLESWEPLQRFVLRRNPGYFEPGLPKVDRVVFQIVPDPSSQLALLRSGQAHYVEFITPDNAATIEAHPDLRITSYLARQFFFVQWNIARPQFASKEVRQALTMAIDRQAIIDSLHYGYASVSFSPFTSDTWVHHKKLAPWPYDPARAKELLAGQGWADSDGDGILDRDGVSFRFELLGNTGNTLRRDIMVMVQEHLKQVGVEVETRLMEFSSMLAPLREHKYDAVVFGLAMDTSLNTYHYFHTRAIDDGYNWGGYSSPETDQLIEEIETQTDMAAAGPLYDRLQELIHEDQPVTFLYESRRLGGAHNSLLDVDPNAISSFFNLRRWRLADPT